MGSYPGNNGLFNPSSYTRQFLGSPMSLRAGSFGGKVYISSSPGMSTDSDDFKSFKMSSSIESDRGSVINALNAFEQQGDLCRNYYCCGKELPDLHALVDHFEDVHVVVLDPLKPQIPYPNTNAAPHSDSTSAYPSTTPTQIQPNPPSQAQSYFPDSASLHQHGYHTGTFDPDDMELDEPPSHSTPSSGAPTPPDTPISTPLSSYHPGLVGSSGYLSQPASPHIQFNESAFDTTTVLPRHKSLKHHAHPFARSNSREMTPEGINNGQYPFNAYAGYSDWSSSMPGTVPSPTATTVEDGQQQCNAGENCVPPALLFSTSAGTTPANTPSSSRVSSPLPHSPLNVNSKASATLSRPASSLLLSKPFKCPKPNCNKSYKQANGLKYHVTHGSCSLKPVREVEAVRVLLASKSSSRNNSQPTSPTMSTPNSPHDGSNPGAMTQAEGDYGLTQEELLAIEKRVRPFACGIGDCTRRYKNMNGLRYHYGHTGEHGKPGLEMLAKGVHECLAGRGGGAGSGYSRPETPEFSQNANVREVPMPSIEPPQLDPAFQAQPVFTQSAQVHIQGQTAFQSPYPFQQQPSYTLAGAMGPGTMYGGGQRSGSQS